LKWECGLEWNEQKSNVYLRVLFALAAAAEEKHENRSASCVVVYWHVNPGEKGDGEPRSK
jgi:hypothetical protein